MAALLAGSWSCASYTPPAESGERDYARQLPPGELGLVPLPAEEPAPDFSIGWHERGRLSEAVQYSLDYLSKPSSKGFFPYGPITHERMVASLRRFQELLDTSASAEEFRAALMSEFEVWMARGRENSGEVLYTGYCRPIFNGSLTRTEKFCYPLYGLPDDLEKGADGAILGRRTESGDVVPYYTAAELRENGHLDGLELVWLDDPFDAYIAQVQGSALIRLPDETMLEVGYAGKNGHEYRSVAQVMIDEGRIPRSRVSLTVLQEYFERNPGEVERLVPMNPSFVFFQESQGGPYGALGVPVTEGRSLATDKDAFPRAGLAYCEVRLPAGDGTAALVQRPYRFFSLDQDRGGAIRSAGRCDVFLGTGDEALARAGHTLSVGRLYYLFLKEGRQARDLG